jgi:pimeloyl-ACP methyl ester carboxylesterase
MRAAQRPSLKAVRRPVEGRDRVSRNLLSRIGIIALVVVSAAVGVVLAPLPASALTDAPAVAIPQRYLDQQVDWQPCDFDEFLRFFAPEAPVTNCASVAVPMDWRHPEAHPDITLAIAYSKATGTSKGLFTAHPGGPGSDAVDFTSFAAVDKPRLFSDYDLLGFDPRGFGSSTNVRCFTTEKKLDRLVDVDDPRARNKKAHAAELAMAKLYGEACSSTEFSRFVSTQQTVYDMEFLRRYLGRDKPAYDKLNYLGYSYGTWLGAWYADTYPDHTGRFILDSNMNWTASMYANQLTDSFSFQRRRDLMFYPWVARRHKTYRLGDTAAKVRRSYEKIRANVLKTYRRGDYFYSVVEADDLIAGQLLANWQFPEAASTLLDLKAMSSGSTSSPAVLRRLDATAKRTARLGAGSAADLRQARKAAAKAEDDEQIEIDGNSTVVRCNDSAYLRDLTKILKRADADAARYRFIGYSNTVSMCSYWKFAPTARTVDLDGAPKILMFQSEGDPASAYEGALAAHQNTAERTRLVSVSDEGQHGVYLAGPSPCVERIGDAFLFNGLLPAEDKVCGTTPLPRDKKVYALKGPLDGKSYSLAATPPSARAGSPNEVVRRARLEAARLSRG